MILTLPCTLSRKLCLILRMKSSSSMKSWLNGLPAFKVYRHVSLGCCPSLVAHPHHPGLGMCVLRAFTLPRAEAALGSQLKETAACLGEFAKLFKQVTKNHEDPKLSVGGR